MPKQHFAILRPTIADLTFNTPSIPAMNNAVLTTLVAISQHTPVSIEEVSSGGDLFRVKAADLSEAHLFRQLKDDWAWIVGANALNFALVYSTKKPESGVWIHFRNPAKGQSKFTPGCHQIGSLS